jgi:hypothetical protein
MQAKQKPILIELLTEGERREAARAAKEIVRLQLSVAAPANGILTQNIYTWIRGRAGTLGEDRQMVLLNMFGITPYGQIATGVTHSWVVSGPEQAPLVEKMLERETDLQNLSIKLAYVDVSEMRKFVGAELRWEAALANGKRSDMRERRLILTAMAGSWVDENFKSWLVKLFESKTDTRISLKKLEQEPIVISIASATNIWRYFNPVDRMVGGKRPMSTPRKVLMPLTQDVVDEQSAKESPVTLLQDITPRFQALAESNAQARDQRISTHDLALLRRAKNVLGQK